MSESPLWANLFHRLDGEEESLREWLSSHPLLKGIGGRDIRHIAALLHRRQYESGEVIFRQGDIGSGFFLVRSGSVRLRMEDPRKGNISLAVLPEGSIVGELSIFDNSPRSATAIALVPTILYGLFEGDLDRLQATRPGLAANLLRNLGTMLALRLKVTNERLQELEPSDPSTLADI